MAARKQAGMTGTQMSWDQPERAGWGGYQGEGGSREGSDDVPGTTGMRMNGNATSGQPDNSELSRFMNNGGGPEPHQGSNPGAQSDPGPKEIGFYGKANDHVLGDDGIRAAGGQQGPMRMGGVSGSQPNPGQRGGQNTSTSGAQTASAYSSPEEYGAESIPGVTGTYGGNASEGEQYSGGISRSFYEGNGKTGARTTGSGGAMDTETRNPVGFAAGMTSEPQSTHTPEDGGRAGSMDRQNTGWGIMHDSTSGRESGQPAYGGESGAEEGGYVYQSRAAQKLVDMRKDSPTTYQRMDEPVEDEKPRVADKAGEVADAVKSKAGGFFSGAKEKVEGFLDVDLDNDGSVGSRPEHVSGASYGGASRETARERAGVGSFRGFETREAVPRASDVDDPMPSVPDRSAMRTDGVSRTETQQRELVNA